MNERRPILLSPTNGEAVYPYCDEARAYLTDAGYMEKGRIRLHKKEYIYDAARPVVLRFESDGHSNGLLLSYGRVGGERTLVALGRHATSYELTNLDKATEYEWSITAYYPEGTAVSETARFRTADLGPRVITAEGICNMRDMGGYVTRDGHKTKQGLLYRSSGFDLCRFAEGLTYLTDRGRDTVKALGIKTELDLRPIELPDDYQSRAELRHLHFGLLQYRHLFTDCKDTYIQALRVLADPENYPIVYHCYGGADRTGTLSLLIGAILGYDDKILINDYEFTSFSFAGIRCKDTDDDVYGGFPAIVEGLAEYEGETLGDRCLGFLRASGLADGDIAAIRKILYE